VRVAAVQLTATDDVDRAIEVADRLTRSAAADGAQLIVLPEKWPAIGAGDVVLRGAQDEDGPAIAWARGTARELGIDLIAGSVSLRDAGRLRNTSLHVGPDGDIRARYAKLHMFDVEVDGTSYRESDHEDAGDATTLTHTAGGLGIGMTICYDLRFPELFRALAVAGAQLFSVPAAFTLATTRDHWDVLVRARAIENGAFVVAANQIGEHPGGLRSGGRSMIVDPWGVILAQAPDSETHIVADLDIDAQAEVRRRLPVLEHRRPETYGTALGATT
jgi:predicted amidohydrolase